MVRYYRIKVWRVIIVGKSRVFTSRSQLIEYLNLLLDKRIAAMEIRIETHWIKPEQLTNLENLWN